MSNTRKVQIGSKAYLVVDLNQPLSEDVEVYPGDPKPKKIIFSDIKRTEYQHHIYQVGDHNFHPHGDAPKHQNPEMQNRGFEVFGLEYCFNQAVLIDLSTHSEAKNVDGIRYITEVRPEHLRHFENQLKNKNVGAVVIRTGYDRWLEENRPHTPKNIPYMTKEAAEYLASKKNIKVVGIDSITIDACGREKPVHAAHQALKDKLIVESLVNLQTIPYCKNGFTLQTSPLRIVGATGGPVVAYALIEG